MIPIFYLRALCLSLLSDTLDHGGGGGDEKDKVIGLLSLRPTVTSKLPG